MSGDVVGPVPDEQDRPTPARRRPRRAVRQPGTVGTDESVLRTTLPAAAQPERAGGVPAPAATVDRSSDALLAVRSADDSDEGWGGSSGMSRENDERLRQDKPPHW
ncbi:hypothetical protein KIN34_01395 [Cellulomonas sp. DKR-3]|uniref:Uncharacterized protein n=1 Tax=Cellulomonas fulva TaxID=2835530 RepID=A0ABS5TUY9_9CELL|nr:hypothetical protein [Cellulomonas fulva]MBT0992945.1 hypothetical protein [Cellulomonas fulva]